MINYYNSTKTDSILKMSYQLSELIKCNKSSDREIVILCIGSDRSTGDSLGPVTGYKLEQMNFKNVFGTLDYPIHASNLSSQLNMIYGVFKNPFIIAIDASIGIPDHIGYITLADGPISPGLGVQKKLPEVGDIHITGIVNTSYGMDTTLLQTTHLSTIMKIADMLLKVFSLTFAYPDKYTNVYSYMLPLPDQLCPQPQIS